MKIWFISDTHCHHDGLKIQDVDLVIHCGDESNSQMPALNEPESREFFEWYRNLPIKHKIFVPGNHSTAIERGLVLPEDYPEINFLIHSQVQVEGVTIFGSPYTPRFHDWAYMKKRSQIDMVWGSIPDKVDILVTHGPPKGILDITHDYEKPGLVQVGCAALRRHVDQRIQPKIHAFGHIHDEKEISNYGIYSRGETQFINCSTCDLLGRLKNNGFVVSF